jgi:DNA-binding NtrC family response regulator
MVKRKVLFIDDEPIILEFAKEQFELANYEIETCESTTLALEVLKNATFDIIISDFNMPHLTGFELVSRIRDDLKLETPVVFLTGNLQLNTVEANRLKIIEIFTKPIDLEEIVQFINKYLAAH